MMTYQTTTMTNSTPVNESPSNPLCPPAPLRRPQPPPPVSLDIQVEVGITLPFTPMTPIQIRNHLDDIDFLSHIAWRLAAYSNSYL